MADLQAQFAFNWWRLFHQWICHNRSEEESARCADVWDWVTDHGAVLRKVSVDSQLDVMGAVWQLANNNNHLPTYDLVKDEVLKMVNNEGALEALKEYEELAGQLKVYSSTDLDAVLKDCCTDFEALNVTFMLQKANRITNGSVESKVRGKSMKLSGPRDALKYLLQRIEQGVLINQNQILRPIDVKKEAPEIVDWYKDSLAQKFFPTGLFHGPDQRTAREVLLERTNFLGILGYLGDGKSTMARFILYNIAAAGFNCLHISLENPGVAERNKFILLHAHNPKFNGAYDHLTYFKLKYRLFTQEGLEDLREVGRDFAQSVEGNLTIEQSGIASWETIKMKIEQHNMMQPLDAVLVDYLQLIDPPNDREADQRARMTSMIKDVRQFQMTFDGGRGICLISPVQANEDGRKAAADSEGQWSRSAVNNDKELARSMDYILGVFNRGRLPNTSYYDLVLSFPKDRDAGDGAPTACHMTGTGWIHWGFPSSGPHANSNAVMRSLDNYDPGVAETVDIE